MEKFEIAKAKALRGDIIKTLYSLYGEEAALSALRNLLRYKSYNSDKDIVKAVEYLSGDKKEFVELRLNESDYWASVVTLTPTGVNLAEGDITDMGVAV